MGTTLARTDATFAYLKVLGNRQGPHALASEFVASSLARWFGLSVPDFAVFQLAADGCFALPRGYSAAPGPVFASRRLEGSTWGGSEAELRNLENPADITRLVVFDTWVRNCDRHPPDLQTRRPNYANVFLADGKRPGSVRLLAIDHTHCFDAGRDLTVRLADIEKVKDEGTYGLFPAFAPFIDSGELVWCKSLLRKVTGGLVAEVIAQLPAEWLADAHVIAAWIELIRRRAAFIADRIESGWPAGTATGA